MNKTELVDKIAKDTNVSKTDVAAVLGSFADSIMAAVKDGDKVVLPGFLTFEQSRRAARTARNPRTGETINIPAATVPKVKVGKSFKDAVG
jgi:DNA-binding protein HU-beta